MAKKNYNLQHFVGQFIEIITTVNITSVFQNEEGVSEKSKPLVVTGIFLGFDEEHIFIGDENGALSDCLFKSQIVNIGIAKTVDKYDELLDNTAIPTTNEGFS